MRVTVIVATHGDDTWQELGRLVAAGLAETLDPKPWQVVPFHAPHATISAARNLAAACYPGDDDWLCFVDADDSLAPDYLAAMDDAERHAGVTSPLLMPAVQRLDERGDCVGLPALPNWDRWPELNSGVVGTLVRRSLFDEVGGFREIAYAEDYDLWLRCVRAGGVRVGVPAAVYCARTLGGGRNLALAPDERLRVHQEILVPHLAWVEEQQRLEAA